MQKKRNNYKDKDKTNEKASIYTHPYLES